MSHFDNKRGRAYQRHFVATQLIEKPEIVPGEKAARARKRNAVYHKQDAEAGRQ